MNPTAKTDDYWEQQAVLRQHIIVAERRKAARREAHYKRTIEELTASVVQLEDDYDSIEAELKALTTTATTGIR